MKNTTTNKKETQQMAYLTFSQRATLQARWLTMKNRKTGIDMVTLAVNYGERLAEKISSKHLILSSKKLRRV